MSKIHNEPKRSTELIILCGAQGCCPTVEIHYDSDKVVITDDNGGKVTLTKKQWREALVKAKVNA